MIGWGWDEISLAAGMVAREGSSRGDEGTWVKGVLVRIWCNLVGLRKLTVTFLGKLWVLGSEEKIWKTSVRICLSFEFGEAMRESGN